MKRHQFNRHSIVNTTVGLALITAGASLGLSWRDAIASDFSATTPTGRVLTPVRADSRAQTAPTSATAPTAPRPPVGAPLTCTLQWTAPLSLGPGRGAQHIAAHGTQAMVTLPTHRAAYEGMAQPAGDDTDWDGYSYTVVESSRSASPSHSDEMRPFRSPPASPTCGWNSVMGAPAWSSGAWTRWFLAGAWGGAACEPCGGATGHADATGVHARYVDTVVPRELVMVTRAGVTFGASVDIWYPDAAACNVTPQIESLVPQGDHLVHHTLLHLPRGSDSAAETADAVAVALSATGAAVLWRANGQAIRLARTNLSGELQGTITTIATNNDHGPSPHVGAPAAAFIGDELLVIWSERAAQAGPYQLRWVQWNPSSPNVPAPAWFRTSPQSQLAPSLASDGDSVALAWMEGDTGRRGAVFVAGARGSAVALQRATPVQLNAAAATNARDPEVALDGSTPWVVWQEFTTGANGAMMIQRLDCHD